MTTRPSYSRAICWLVAGVAGLGGTMAAAAELGEPTPWAGPPVLLRASDAVRPGETLFLHGEGLASQGLRIVMAPGVQAKRPPKASEARLAYSDHGGPGGPQGQFAMAEVPASLPPGLFTVWAANAQGWCAQPLVVNLPRPQWLSEREAWPGQELRLVGYNLLGSEFGAQAETRVHLASGGKQAAAKVLDANPFAVRFAVPEAPRGTYRVEVSNDGGKHWVRAPDTLVVVAQGEDPLGLGVAWAGGFAWSRRLTVEAAIAGAADDTARIQQAIDAAKAAGGGVAFLPAGEYRVNSLRLPARVVLMGEGPTRTILTYVGTGAPPVCSAGDGQTDGRHGVARLGLKVAPGALPPDCFILLGQPWGPAAGDVSVRTAEALFCHEVSVEYDLKTPTGDGHRGLGLIAIGRERCLIDHCTFRGYYSPPHRVLLNRYVWCHDNEMEFSNGVFVTTAAESILERKHMVGHRENVPDEARNPADLHGIFARDHLYAAENVIEGMGVHEGEAICVENPLACQTYGKVWSAEGCELALESAVPYDWAKFDLAKRLSGAWHVVIVGGRGLGQYRQIAKAEGARMTVDRPWDVLPDASSLFTILLPNDHVIMYRNTARDCTKGFWFYGNVIDAVAAENVSENSEGVFANSYHTPQGVFSTIYFIRMARNRVRGVSPRTHHAGVGFSTSRTSLRTYYGVHSLGMEIRDNDIAGVPEAKPFAGSECPLISGIFGVFYSGFEGAPGCDRVGTVIEGNRLRDLQVGVTLGRDNCGTVLRNNALTNVTTPLEDRGSRGLVKE